MKEYKFVIETNAFGTDMEYFAFIDFEDAEGAFKAAQDVERLGPNGEPQKSLMLYGPLDSEEFDRYMSKKTGKLTIFYENDEIPSMLLPPEKPKHIYKRKTSG